MTVQKRKRSEERSAIRPEKKQKPSESGSRLIVHKEEPAFQRGGASVLTPLEQKQIQVQATSDALFEERTGKKASTTEFGDEENEEDTAARAGTVSAKVRRKPKIAKEGRKRLELSDDEATRIEGLSYKVCQDYYLENSADDVVAACPWLYNTWSSLTD